jgi:photoactive yellow protein
MFSLLGGAGSALGVNVEPIRGGRRGKTKMAWSFTDPDLLERLEQADDAALDTASFGVIAMTLDGVVTSYNATESRTSGLSPDRVRGRHFFSAVAPCMNNFMVSTRFDSEAELDVVLDYVFTLRMRPTAVRLRMLKQPGRRRMYLLVEQK